MTIKLYSSVRRRFVPQEKPIYENQEILSSGSTIPCRIQVADEEFKSFRPRLGFVKIIDENTIQLTSEDGQTVHKNESINEAQKNYLYSSEYVTFGKIPPHLPFREKLWIFLKPDTYQAEAKLIWEPSPSKERR